MATVIVEVYDALREAGASEDRSRAAATAVASYDDKLHILDAKVTKLDGDVGLLKWMVGFNIALTLALFAVVLRYIGA